MSGGESASYFFTFLSVSAKYLSLRSSTLAYITVGMELYDGTERPHLPIRTVPDRPSTLTPDTASPDAELLQSDEIDIAIQAAEPSPSADAKATEEDSSTDSDRPSGSYGDVLKNLNFLALWSGQVFSQLSDKIFLVLLVALIASHFQTPGESIEHWVSAVMIAFTIPAVLFGSLAGVFVDRWSTKWVMVTTNLVRGGLVLSIPLLFWGLRDRTIFGGHSAGFLGMLAIAFTVSTLTQFFAPAEQTAIPLIVDKPLLLPANSLYTTTMMASVIVGFAIGDPILELANRLGGSLNWGPERGSEVAVGGGYAIAGLILLMMKTGERDRPKTTTETHVWSDLKEGLDYLKTSQSVRFAIMQLTVLFSIFAALAVLAVRLAELIPQLDSSQFGLLLAAAGVGMGLGALLVGQWGDRLSRAFCGLLGSIGVAIALTCLGFVDTLLWPSLVAIAGIGCAGAFVGVPMQTLIQEETPEQLRGKVFGLQNNLINIALTLPLALASLAEAAVGLSPVLWGLAAITAIAGVSTWAIKRDQ